MQELNSTPSNTPLRPSVTSLKRKTISSGLVLTLYCIMIFEIDNLNVF